MTLQDACDFFKSLTNESTKKQEIKAYKKFHHILTELKSREFSAAEIQSI